MSRLLRYVVECSLEGDRRRLTEYRIGLEALGKRPDSYSPADDPSVRVQMGRLRDRLRRYYASSQTDEVLFEIPGGSYMATISPIERKRESAWPEPLARNPTLTIARIESIAGGEAGTVFALGLREELGQRLFEDLGDCLMLVSAPDGSGDASGAADYRLEGSVRRHDDALRVMVRVVEQRSSRVLWSEPFGCPADPVLKAQETLAGAICGRLQCTTPGLIARAGQPPIRACASHPASTN